MSKNNQDLGDQETGMFLVPKPVKIMRAYGTQSYVCYKHKGGAGASVIQQGKCQNCQDNICSGCGALPKLCDKCSIDLSQCKYCRTKVLKG